ncbi:ABC transporter ATP-binding protein [Oscillatoria amoena NRMC-F 0135]|nr:ABC transporter ATP-binding protein [Oscillatoria amoena NRMC-F 0135]
MSDTFFDSSLPNVIELRGIRQTYDGKKYVLDGLDFIVPDKPNQGQFIALMGASGCGKSTLLRYICNLQQPTEGTVLLNGKPLDEKTRVSMVFQNYSSLPWFSVLDNVALPLKFKGVGKKERVEKAMEMIKLVGLEGHEDKYAKMPALSGGQLQRVAIARSLIANPEIIVMDEPFGALDINTRLQMQDMLEDIWLKFHSTIIFVTHDITEAVYLGDEVYIMAANPGRIAHRVNVDLPFNRTRESKREKRFIELVNEVEDLMNIVSTTEKKSD